MLADDPLLVQLRVFVGPTVQEAGSESTQRYVPSLIRGPGHQKAGARWHPNRCPEGEAEKHASPNGRMENFH